MTYLDELVVYEILATQTDKDTRLGIMCKKLKAFCHFTSSVCYINFHAYHGPVFSAKFKEILNKNK